MRLSFSGDGCGADWPLCHNELLPDKGPALIEWIHRATSGLCLILTAGLFVLALKLYPSRAPAKKAAKAALLFILIEALIGALLVTGGFVAGDESWQRLLLLALHLLNSLFLTAALSLCVRTALWRGFRIKKRYVYFAMAFVVLALTGNIASLAGQLFPAGSLSEAFYLDFSPSSHISLRLRILHPLFALLFLAGAWRLLFFERGNSAKILLAGAGAVGLVGFTTYALLSPLEMKIIHLISAYALWTGLVRLCVEKKNPL